LQHALTVIYRHRLKCADGVPGLWRLDVIEQYGSAFPYQHENERSCAT